jgi:transcriptional regulator GlxA family with amidase domain
MFMKVDPAEAGASPVGAVIIIENGPTMSSVTGTYRTSGRLRLSLWQMTRVTAHVDANIDATIHNYQLASLVRVRSLSHFCRLFRNSFGVSPHNYVMRTRLKRAKALMLSTSTPLGQIAADCGFVDQAHLSRLFRRHVGDTPGAWRRARLPDSSTAPRQARPGPHPVRR